MLRRGLEFTQNQIMMFVSDLIGAASENIGLSKIYKINMYHF